MHTARLPTASILIERDWSAGDVAAISGTNVVVACQETERKGALAYTSLRVFDVAAQRLVSILPGHNSFASLKRQLCAETDNLVFSCEDRSHKALVFDLRTNAPELSLGLFPSITEIQRMPTVADLRSLGNGQGVLGVPTSTSPMAFTWGGHCQCIRAWDLRMPVSHVYTMSTGNQKVRDLQWHAASASLLAVTEDPLAVQYGSVAKYRGFEQIDYSDEDEYQGGDSFWPQTAAFEGHYFPRRYHVDTGFGFSTDRILQYAFKDGFEMGRGKSAPGMSVKGKEPAADY